MSIAFLGSTWDDNLQREIVGQLLAQYGGLDKRWLERAKKEWKERSRGGHFFSNMLYDWRRLENIDFKSHAVTIVGKQLIFHDVISHRRKTLIKVLPMCDTVVMVLTSNSLTNDKEEVYEKLYISKLCGLEQFIFCWENENGVENRLEIANLCAKVGIKSYHVIPTCSKLIMDEQEGCNWSALIELILNFKRTGFHCSAPLRIPILDKYKIGGIGTVLVGRISSGSVKVGDSVHVGTKTSSTVAIVKSIEKFYASTEEAHAGDFVGLCVARTSINDVSKGFVASPALEPLCPVMHFEAKVKILHAPKKGFCCDMLPTLYCHISHCLCKIDSILAIINGKTLEPTTLYPTTVKPGEFAHLRIIPFSQFFVECYDQNAKMGKIFLVLDEKVVAVGKVTKITPFVVSTLN